MLNHIFFLPCVCICVRVRRGQRATLDVSPYLPYLSLCLRQSLSLFTDVHTRLSRLRPLSRFSLSLPSILLWESWDWQLCCSWLYVGSGNLTSCLTLEQQALYPRNHLPSPMPHLFRSAHTSLDTQETVKKGSESVVSSFWDFMPKINFFIHFNT